MCTSELSIIKSQRTAFSLLPTTLKVLRFTTILQEIIIIIVR